MKNMVLLEKKENPGNISDSPVNIPTCRVYEEKMDSIELITPGELKYLTDVYEGLPFDERLAEESGVFHYAFLQTV